MPELNVLIVDDSPFMRKVFSDVVDTDAAFKVLATAANGEEAVRLAIELKPDIITMDLEMPRMNGIEALKKIMSIQPTPIIMLSAVTDHGTRDTIRALQYGAFDFIRKPDGAVNLDIRQVKEQLIEKLHIAMESMNGGSWRMLPAVEERAESLLPPPIKANRDVAPLKEEEKETHASDEALSRPGSASSQTPLAPVSAKSASPPRATPSAEIKRKPAPALPDTLNPIAARKQKPPDSQEVKEILRKTGAKLPTAPGDPKTIGKKTPKSAARAERRPAAETPPATENPKTSTHFTQLVAIGTSTGGPRALHEVLTGIPADFPAPILVVQHMPPKFTHSLAQRLDNFCDIHVREATDGELVETATAYIAPGGWHMNLAKDDAGKYRIKLSNEGPRSGHMPSVDMLFESLVGHHQLKRHIVLMTGMGSDGAKGMKALLEDGATNTIAEAEETCVVYGMPRSAVELGAATRQLPLQTIAQALVQDVKSARPNIVVESSANKEVSGPWK
ncbi:protein-glutamate methylesterase/protein-glutamine glutaminase [Cohnella terricola]|uniref:Protein-glutamate methylesterase/protein-glutamine glutaminase n=1 Tax=Cohnella terricola TaxID=1289167 RepID=A0A559JCP0_9BACL|nr:chemotaxis response regulator protein-glutamate methylesterase [Cohnella terricola]TVX97646.1 response regulator [Cohnella terricola]